MDIIHNFISMFHVSNRDDGGHWKRRVHVFIALDSLGTFHHGIIGDIGSVPGVLPRAVLGGYCG